MKSRYLLFAALILSSTLLFSNCTRLGQTGTDLDALQRLAQGRKSKIATVNAVLDELIVQPAPGSMSAAERSQWDSQTQWLVRVKTRLTSASTNLDAVLNRHQKLDASSGLDAALTAAQLAGDYVRLNNDFQALLADIGVEANNNDPMPEETRVNLAGDTTGGKQIVFSSPVKARHERAMTAISTLA